MASSSVLNVASFRSTRTFGRTDAEVADILLWFIEDWADPEPEGLTQAQLYQWRLERAHDRMIEDTVTTARNNRLRALQAAQGDLAEQARAETQL